ncbi:CoxG family protein [Sandaracinobacteroides hominis]|uniref:CoxG family protein n=1 Tax=Sandaracinobacteroides hominis TaxID=2780086 RepID=UPI0018F52C17|nr:carbon monoxide dehydrogenase subunit G [Sandaracinobacteroides hominis]
MNLEGETLIQAGRDRVWAALNDPAVLARCIDGVESLEQVEPNRFAGVLNAKVGPVKARFTGQVDLTELDPPNRYVLVGEGKGGVAGFAKGSAEVALSDAEGGATRLTYVARSQVGGKLAQLGTRLIEGTARSYAENFFAAFKAEVEGDSPAPEAAAAAELPAATPLDPVATPSAAEIRADAASAAVNAVEAARPGLPGWVWIGGLVLLVIAALVAIY